ncbi:hypothetical protein CRG98_032465 [Punica granatum]|uniref:Myb/SANT-like domain-containing protein n=1 Tax=Punica granatum TaxID=22663 RepID=A0A2I0IT09_PUNGR|nr:hypothetical protein CRG98_032465 [Punica granatum]
MILGANKVKTKAQRLKTQYTQFTELIQHTGVGWDGLTNTVKASPDIWDKFIKRHSNFMTFCSKGCKHCEALKLMYKTSTVTGGLRISSTDPPQSPRSYALIEEEFLASQKNRDKKPIDLAEGSVDSDEPPHEADELVVTGSRRRVRKRGSNNKSQLQELIDLYKETRQPQRKRRMPRHVNSPRYDNSWSDDDDSSVDDLPVLLAISDAMSAQQAPRARPCRTSALQGMPTYTRPRNVEEQPEIRGCRQWYPFFRHCIGAIDGTHVDAIMPASVRGAYRDRNGDITQNVLAVCSHQMIFTYVITGWEEQYYVVDASFPNIPGYLTPYKGQRYHCSNFNNDNPPTTMEELFNQ